MEKIKLEVAGVPAVLYGKRSRRVYLYVHGKNGSAAARMSLQNTSIQPHSSTKSTVDGTTLSVSMEMAVTASITGK